MTLRDPIVAYNATNNLEAHMVCGQLRDSDIEAMVMEDVSNTGVWVGGTISQIHKPQVMIERADTERARTVLQEYERRIHERLRATEAAGSAPGSPIKVQCEKCGKSSEFPTALRGSVENCPFCQAYVDVGDETLSDEWYKSPEDNDDTE